MEPKQTLTLNEINLTDLTFWNLPAEEREGAFKTLREQHPVAFFEEPEYPSPQIQRGPGFYALTRHADILEVSRQPKLFCSGRTATGIADIPEPFGEYLGSMINMDDPRHGRLRRIVSAAFTPRILNKLESDVQRAACDIVTAVRHKGECDFVTEVAARLPLKIICDMMGIPPSEYGYVFDRANVILGAGDPEYVPDGDAPAAVLNACTELFEMMDELASQRETDPRDDLITALVHAESNGERLTRQELGSFFVLLVGAGNETTRNAISHGLIALTEHPEQRQVWEADFDAVAPTAVDEIVRWASPVIFMRRTATQDATVGDHTFHDGDKLLLYYNSGNRDEGVFEEPYTFDLRRTPNPHVGFGGPGPHYCLGAHLARREITVMFRELFRTLPDIRAAGEPTRLQSYFVNGIKHLPCAFTSGGRA